MNTPRRLVCQHPQCRSFSVSSARHTAPKTNILSLLPTSAPPPPPYPYPRNYFFKQANHGLYGGAKIQFGNNVSERTETKTRRKWIPNVKHKHLYSKALGRTLRMKVSTRVLRSIDKAGGVDEYVLGEKPARVKELGEEGWNLRWAVLQSPSMRRRVKQDPVLQKMVRNIESGAPSEGNVQNDLSMSTRSSPRNLGGWEPQISEDAERIRRLHMVEEPAPMGFWARIGATMTRPFRRAA